MDDTGIVTTAVIPADSGADKPISSYYLSSINW